MILIRSSLFSLGIGRIHSHRRSHHVVAASRPVPHQVSPGIELGQVHPVVVARDLPYRCGHRRPGKYWRPAGHHHVQTPVHLGNAGDPGIVPAPGVDTETGTVADPDLRLGSGNDAAYRHRPLPGGPIIKADSTPGNRAVTRRAMGGSVPRGNSHRCRASGRNTIRAAACWRRNPATRSVPIAHNAGYLWPRNGFLKRPGTIKMVIGPPMQSRGKKAAQITREAEEWIEAAVAGLPVPGQ